MKLAVDAIYTLLGFFFLWGFGLGIFFALFAEKLYHWWKQ